MEWLFYASAFMCFIVAAIVDGIAEVKSKDWSYYIFLLGLMSGIIFNIGLDYRTTTAMDVYQDKTTLEITYKDGIPVDSVVVFKDKEK